METWDFITAEETFIGISAFVFAGICAIVVLKVYGGLVFGTQRMQSMTKQSGIDDDAMYEKARQGLRRAKFALFGNVGIIMGWLLARTLPLAWRVGFIVVSMGFCVPLVFLIARLEKLRRRYRPSAPVQLAAGH